MNWDQMQCDHKFRRENIIGLHAGMRWVCVKCDTIAPACFMPKLEAICKVDS